MYRFVLLFLSAVLLSISAGPNVVQGPAAASHHLLFENKLDQAGCSATAVGPHTLLTAAHCMIGTDKVNIDGTDAAILTTIYDGEDHELIITDQEFTFTLPIEQRPPAENEHVRVFGFPGKHHDLVPRDGHFEHAEDDLFVFTLPCYPGDSGSGLISDGNTVIGVVSLGNTSAETAAFLLSFTPSQLAQIK